ncbi:X-ray radiation resistance-associated protein 1 [Anableps anableps]
MEETHWKGANKEAGTTGGITLDGCFLLQLCCVDEPSQLYSVDISEKKLNSVEPEELKAFRNVAYIEAADNFLSLGLFSCFISLRELNLSLNRISNMVFDPAEFPHLEVLDLSFNSLSAEDLLLLGQIPCLKTLHLTGNRLHSLPPNFGASHSDQSDLMSEEGAKQFEALEVLMLDDNRLTSTVFYSLTNLKRLKHLNLQGNRISEIPCMELKESLKPGPISALRQGEEEAHTESTIDHHLKIIKIFDTLREDDCRGPSLFLPELQRLILADNKIASEEALVAAALFPKLCELDIHSNPLIRRKRGDTSLLTFYLQERLGIKIKRKKGEDFVKLPLVVSTYPERKTEDEPELQLNSSLNQNKSAQNKQGNKTSPEQSKCYDMIMDAKPIPEIGIQTAVRMLEQTLRNLNIYRDSRPRLDSIQTPYREMEKRIKELPPLSPIKQPTQKVDELIKEMKESTTVTVVSLGSVIHNRRVNKEDYKEALFLLRDMKKKYKMVHEKTMELKAKIQITPKQSQTSTFIDSSSMWKL